MTELEKLKAANDSLSKYVDKLNQENALLQEEADRYRKHADTYYECYMNTLKANKYICKNLLEMQSKMLEKSGPYTIIGYDKVVNNA